MSAPILCDLVKTEIAIDQRLRLFVPALKIRGGTIAVMIGPNGSGKSTLARYLCRIDGSERIERQSEVRPLPAAVMVWQSLNLFPLTVHRNVSIVKRNGIEAALKYFNVWIMRNMNADNLSGGERQKLAILRSLVAEAQMVVLDEPTSSLDSRTIEDLVEVIGVYTGHSTARSDDYLKELQAHSGDVQRRSILIITHDQRFVRLLSRYESLKLFSVAEDPKRPFNQPHYVLNAGSEGDGYTMERVHLAPPDPFTADFFGIPNVIGFTSAAGRPRGPGDFCSRFKLEAVGRIIFRDNGITIRTTQENGQLTSSWKGTVVGTEYVGTQKRVRLSVFGQHGTYEMSVPAEAITDQTQREVFVSFNFSDKSAWSVIQP